MKNNTWVVDSNHAWHSQLQASVQDSLLLRTRLLLYTILISIISLVVWAYWAELDQITRGQGKAVPSSQRQIIQTFDGGAVADILVREGDRVEVGDLLVRIDATRFRANFRESQAESLALRARMARLEAMIKQEDLTIDSDIQQQAPNLWVQEQQLFLSIQNELSERQQIAEQQLIQRQQEKIEAEARAQQLRQSMTSLNRELAIMRPLLAAGAVSEIDIIRLDRDLNNQQGEVNQLQARSVRLQASIDEAQATLNELTLNATNQWQRELSDTQNRLAVVSEGLSGLEDRVRFTDIRSPTRGIVQRLYVSAAGAIVQPGREVVEITPLDDQLLFETKVAPQDIAFIHLGQAAVIKVSAYDYAIFGGLTGTVTHISPDTITDEQGNSYYLIRVESTDTQLRADLIILPGMTAQVDIITGKHSILNYLLKPIQRAMQGALRER